MRAFLASIMAFGLLVAMGVSANAATVHRQRARPHVTADPGPGMAAPGTPSATPRFAVPGWSDESTRRWLDNASALVGVGG
jgi:hypothetical protein